MKNRFITAVAALFAVTLIFGSGMTVSADEITDAGNEGEVVLEQEGTYEEEETSAQDIEDQSIDEQISDEDIEDEDIEDDEEASDPEVTEVPSVTPTTEPSSEPTSEPAVTTVPTSEPSSTPTSEPTATPVPTSVPTATPAPTTVVTSREKILLDNKEEKPANPTPTLSIIPPEQNEVKATATPKARLAATATPTVAATAPDEPQPLKPEPTEPMFLPTQAPSGEPTPTDEPEFPTPTPTKAVPTRTPLPTVTGIPNVTSVPTIPPREVTAVPVTPTLTPEMTERQKEVAAFVDRLYAECLGRGADEGGKVYWINELLNGNLTGAQVAEFFLFSEEYQSFNKDDKSFIDTLYTTFFDRDADQGGYDFWTNVFDTTVHSRKYVFQNFVNSDEYDAICKKYNINRGFYASDDICDVFFDVASYTGRLYSNVLNRRPDKGGIDFWTNLLVTYAKSPEEVSDDFFESDEFISRNLDNSQYVDVLYHTCMGREADAEGKANWVSLLDNNATRRGIRHDFMKSEEFREIIASSGLIEHPMVTVAKTQLGEEGGLKYCNWYGYSYRIEWCACFVSWCADQCGYIQSGIVPKYKWCLDARDWFLARGQWISDNTYAPKSGDIIFYDWNGNGVIDHTGIVVGTDSTGRIHTIEGNVSDVVRNDRELYIGDEDICGYGVPAY